jgi:Fe-S cluster assembly scaffold protein SufB
MEQKEITINRLPAPTWNYLRMNQVAVQNVRVEGSNEVRESYAEGFQPDADGNIDSLYNGVVTGCGSEIDQVAGETGAKMTTVISGKADNLEHPACLEFSYQNNEYSVNQVGLETKFGAALTVFMDFGSEAEAEGSAIVQTKIVAAPKSHVRLVQVQHLGKGFRMINDLGVIASEGAQVEIVQIFMGAAEMYSGCETTLKGDDSDVRIQIGYLRSDAQLLDMNYVIRHYGKRSNSVVNTHGALDGQSKKIFRGTIDFIKGGKTATGAEKEDVLLMSDSVINQTIPLILCAEEDVAGSHGASIGRPDEEVLFYLQSRGIPEAECYRILAKAKLDAACSEIANDELREKARQLIEESYGSEAVAE